MDERRGSLIAEVTAGIDAESDCQPQLVTAYYGRVLTEDLAARNPEDIRATVLSHLSLGRTRQPGETLVAGFTPQIQTHGWAPGATVIQVVTDDKPFIVDSITTGLSRQGEEPRMVVHPQLRVLRDESGKYLGLGEDGIAESWVHIELAQVPDQQAVDDLVELIRQILGDVDITVADWPLMAERAAEISAELADGYGPAVVPEEARALARQLLDWLVDDHFIFLGYRRYKFAYTDEGAVLEQEPDSSLGLMRRRAGTGHRLLVGPVAEKAVEPELLIITKANSRSTVHRDAYLDYIGIKTFDEQGNVDGEHRFIGLLTSNVYYSSVETVPIVAYKVQTALKRSGYDRGGNAGKRMVDVFERLPLDEILQSDVEQLAEVTTKIVASRFQQQTLLFVRPDIYGRFVSCLVVMPRERYSAEVRQRVEQLLLKAFDADESEYSARVGEPSSAMMHFIIRRSDGQPAQQVDVADLQDWVRATIRTWAGEWRTAMIAEFGEGEAARLVGRWSDGLDDAYKALHAPRLAAFDVRQIEQLAPGAVQASLNQDLQDRPGARRLRLYCDRALALTEVLPILLDFGLRVIDERTHRIVANDDAQRFILDFGVAADDESYWDADDQPDSGFLPAFHAVWQGRAESDSLNQLIGQAGLSWPQVVALRMAVAYLQQTTPYSRDYLESSLVDNPKIARQLVALFEARFRPDAAADRAERETAAAEAVLASLADVPSLDHDRMIREYVDFFLAGLRTNFYQTDANGQTSPPLAVAFKLDPGRIPHLPEPRPQIETWVYSPRLEGVHLRFGLIARGGLRWSDRRDDFRTEVLGLVKAQSVKNAVIVPAGAKGGFYAKDLPDPGRDRSAWLAAGRAAYRQFVSALLSVADNIVDGKVEDPVQVVLHDGDDPYLVVAADKGTASFSDLANEVSDEHGFWLSDAFASGGSTGYDHKGMAITARGAWESVKRHFLEMGIDTQTTEFTAVGVGDMSGDVFGNGMLRSPHTRLVAAFDHRHIFVDPNPDAATSFAERQRLFELPFSSWADYDASLISEGGGVFPRTAKAITVTPQLRDALGMGEVSEVTPTELIKAVLKAPVDLLWNGGIGTYIKASTEVAADIGDRSNDAVRIDGSELRVKVVGEGGNLGVSQLGRIEAAQAGVRINTDAIDNSGGVDSSDQEVNIKILLGSLVGDGKMTLPQRNELLQSMTDEVADNVLRTNYQQNVLLANARYLKGAMLGAQERLMDWLEDHGGLDRELEFLPSTEEMTLRANQGAALTSPEFAVLVAYAKMALKKELLASSIPDDPWFESELAGYFPAPLRGYTEALANHRLRREIIATQIANGVVNRGGITFGHRVLEDTGASLSEVAKAFFIAREVFDLGEYAAAVEALDGSAPTETQSELYLEFRQLLDRVVRYILGRRPQMADVGTEIERYQDAVRELRGQITELYGPTALDGFNQRAAAYVDQGATAELAANAAGLTDGVAFVGIVDLAERIAQPPTFVARGYLRLAEELQLSEMMRMLEAVPGDARWDAVAKSALRDELYRLVLQLTEGALAAGDDSDAADRVQQWMTRNQAALSDVLAQLANLRREPSVGLGHFLVIQRELQKLTRAA